MLSACVCILATATSQPQHFPYPAFAQGSAAIELHSCKSHVHHLRLDCDTQV